MTRIVALGDSISFGVGEATEAEFKGAWSGRLATAIGSAQHVRYAWPGACVADLGNAQLKATLMSAPDIALVSIGGNDAIRRGFDCTSFAEQLRAALEALRAAVPSIVLVNLPDISRTCAMPKKMRPHLHNRVEQLNCALSAAAAGTGVLLLDRWSDPDVYLPSHLAPDRVHPSSQGYQALAHRTAELLNRPIHDSGDEQWLPEPGQAWWIATKGVPWVIKRSMLLVPGAISLMRTSSASRFSN